MKDTFYFQHDYDARQDKKIVRLMAKHGMRGYGIFWAIIENLYSNANALQTDYESIAYLLHEQSDIVESIIKDFDLFVFEGDTFGSSSVESRLNERNEKSGKARDSANKRWQLYKEENANALQTQSEGNAIKERKGKEKKENEIINTHAFNFKKALIEAGADEALANDWIQVRKVKKAANTQTALNTFLAQVKKSGRPLNFVLKVCVDKSWKGFAWDWELPIEELSTKKTDVLYAD